MFSHVAYQKIATQLLDEKHFSSFQMLKAGAKSTVWPKAKTESEKSPQSVSARRAGSDDSDNEDKVPVPEFHSSFGSALEAAFESIQTRKGMERDLCVLTN